MDGYRPRDVDSLVSIRGMKPESRLGHEGVVDIKGFVK